jgi:hypothetical protein
MFSLFPGRKKWPVSALTRHPTALTLSQGERRTTRPDRRYPLAAVFLEEKESAFLSPDGRVLFSSLLSVEGRVSPFPKGDSSLVSFSF